MLWQWLLQPFGRCGTCGTPLLIQRSLFQRLWIPLSAIKVAIFAVLMGTMGTNLSWLALILAIALILADGVAVVRTGRLTKRRGSL